LNQADAVLKARPEACGIGSSRKSANFFEPHAR